MSFKIHLIIVCCIVLVVYLVWQINSHTSSQPIAAVPQSPYKIIIVHASWGQNCRPVAKLNQKTDGFASDVNSQKNKLSEDNVLSVVSKLCSDKLICDIKVNAETMETDPAPDCPEKELAVEYRCFNYDRPWTIKSSDPIIRINCEQTSK